MNGCEGSEMIGGEAYSGDERVGEKGVGEDVAQVVPQSLGGHGGGFGNGSEKAVGVGWVRREWGVPMASSTREEVTRVVEEWSRD